MSQLIANQRFPYISVVLEIGTRQEPIEALIDTGFDGDLTVPAVLLQESNPIASFKCVLADGSEIESLVYRGRVRLGGFAPIVVEILAIGDEPILGRGVTDRFMVILDHGRQVRIEP